MSELLRMRDLPFSFVIRSIHGGYAGGGHVRPIEREFASQSITGRGAIVWPRVAGNTN